MADSLLADPDRKEALSRVYVKAVAASAGYGTADYDLDRDSIDLRIQAGGDMRPALELQLKATAHLEKSHDEYVKFRLGKKNYDDLRTQTQTPRLLVVLELPKEENKWITVTPDELVVRHRAYWLSLSGYEAIKNQSSITVKIPEQNRFNSGSLHALMEQSRTGRI